jgi:SAM-dependent methyltransferase
MPIAEAPDAHCLLWDYERARQIAPYGDESWVAAATREVVRCGGAVLQTHKLAPTDHAHVAVLLRCFDPPQGAEVLDAGCGVGAVAFLMAELRPDLRFSLLNFSAAQLELAPAWMPKIHGDFQKMPIEAATFDAVMFCYSLGHGLLDACISEAARVLRPGGVLFIYDITTNDHAHVIPRVGYRPHSRAEVEAAGQRHGFVTSYVIENPPATTDHFRSLFGQDALHRHGLERTWPIICRFTKPPNDAQLAFSCR